MRLVRSFVVIAALGAVLAPASALAGVSVDAYRTAGPQVVEEISQNGPGPTPADSAPVAAAAQAEDEGGGGDLPFTGLDVALVLGAGLVLLGVGIAMRRLTGPSEVA